MLRKEDLVNSLSDMFECPLCLGIIQEPVFAGGNPCQHAFCKECISASIETSPRCPTCRLALTTAMLQPHLFIRSLLDEVTVHCPSRCGWTGRFDRRITHLQACPLNDLRKELDKAKHKLKVIAEELTCAQTRKMRLHRELAAVEQDCAMKLEDKALIDEEIEGLERRLGGFREPTDRKETLCLKRPCDALDQAQEKRRNTQKRSAADQDKVNDALFKAAGNGHCQEARRLVTQMGADVEAKNKDGELPLALAAQNGHRDVVEFLVVEAAAEVHPKKDQSSTPIHDAARNGHRDVVEALIVKGKANANRQDTTNGGGTPLHEAVFFGHVEVVNYLVTKAKVNVNVVDENGMTPLSLATMLQKPDVKRRIIKILQQARAV